MSAPSKFTDGLVINEIVVSIDTVILVANLSYLEKRFINERFSFKKGNEHFQHSITNKEPFFVLNMNPRNQYAKRYYNTMLILQKKIINNVPYSIKEIIMKFDWKFKRLDIAFDSKQKFGNHGFLKHHGNVKTHSKISWNGYYIGSKTSKTLLAVYDRNKREEARNSNLYFQFPTRFEFRFRPKISSIETIHNFDDELIINELKKYMFIENINNIETSQWNKNRLNNLRSRLFKESDYKQKWSGYSAKVQEELKHVMNMNRIPFEELYIKHKEVLFSWMKNDDEIFQSELEVV